jgi:hypothetical protein
MALDATFSMNPSSFPSDEDLGFLQLASSEVLAAVVRGEVDLNTLASRQLAARGLDSNARWVGFDAAARASVDSTTAPFSDTASIVIASLSQLHAEISDLPDIFGGYDSDATHTSRLLSELWALVPSCDHLSVDNLVAAWYDTQECPEGA